MASPPLCLKRTVASGFFLAFIGLVAVHSVNAIQIDGNGYTDIVVAIAPHISEKEGAELLPKLKELFEAGSVALYNATRKRAYFKEVLILVPDGWTNINFTTVMSVNFHEADIRVDDPNPSFGNGPYTLQPLPCGSPGQYIHLTPDYLRDLREKSTENFGPPGKTLVHEWAHLRYGIFDEFGYHDDSQYPILYFKENQELTPNACVNEKLHGKFRDIALYGDCKFVDGYPDKNCIYVPDKEKNTANSSIASYHYLPLVTVFCDAHQHDRKAPNKHNALCNYQSTWEVIENHDDFKANNNPANEIRNFTPTFKIVKRAGPAFCLAVDVSKSMDKKLDMMKDAVARLILYDLPLPVAVGVVTFSKDSRTLLPVEWINNDTRRSIVNEEIQADLKIDSEADEGTCIVCGLRNCENLLSAYEISERTIVVMTDGEEGNASDTIDNYQKKDVKVYVILIESDTGSPLLEGLAKAFHAHDQLEMDNFLNEIIDDQLPGAADVPIKIHERKFNASGYFLIDSSMGKNTAVFITPITNIKNITITGPSLTVDISNKSSSSDDNNIIFNFDILSPGQYNYIITKNSEADQIYTIAVTTKPLVNEAQKPITVRSWIHEDKVDGGDLVYAVYAEVKQGMNPVINAQVTAEIHEVNSNKDTASFSLYDHGNGAPDVTRDDGIYSRYFTQFSGKKGRYSVEVHVQSQLPTSIQAGFSASSSMPVVNGYMAGLDPRRASAEPFERVTYAKELEVAMDIPIDSLLPNRVTDLQVVNITAKSNLSVVALKWTAPGAHLDNGKASKYSLRYARTWEALFEDFENNGTECEVANQPSEGGAQEVVAVNVSGLVVGVTYYMGLRAYSSHWSQTSNIVSVQIIVSNEVDQTIPIIVGIVLGALFLLFVLASLVFYIKQKHRKTS